MHFTHFTHTSSKAEIAELIEIHGVEAYGVMWVIFEKIGWQSENIG